MSDKKFLGHPRGLFLLFIVEMWERFSYYGMRAILLLFLLDKTKGGMGLNEGEGGAIYGLYTFSVYLLSLPGGWLADNIFGQRKSIWYGGLAIMAGHVVLAFPASQTVFFAGLALVAIGTGLLKPNISSIVSELYPEGGAIRDAAFSIFYMGINMGSFLGITIVGYLGQKIGWHYGFGAAAIAMLLGLVAYRLFASTYLGEKGLYPKASIDTEEKTPVKTLTWILIGSLFIFLVIMQVSGTFKWDSKQAVAASMGVLAIAVVMTYFLNMFFASGFDRVEQKRLAILFILFWGAVLFWAGFEQQGSSLQIFADRYSELPFGMPSSWFQNFNPFYILVFAPVVGGIWVFLEKRGLNPPLLIKFSIGLFLLALGYYIMVIGAKTALSGVKASAWILTFTYLFHTLGELCLSPVGLSAYTKLAPKKYLSQLMGIWFVAAALGNLFAGLFAGGFDEENIHQMPEMFMSIVWFCLVVGSIIFILQRPLKNWTGGIK
ncbi:peptide MFS transporter [Siphonobacter sp. SORGH_AS_1065]|uniref:peptide MFS transporter n=1 Tax=Siphonobacter sp. SORGH_AS_1065 TaxID=3041795 RepID=UPI002780C5DB|nr:peptide MFS transporter [Siphonobacter sp. SORGH_AS_1065]MDQ1087785.1 POT family proton-dependent oligopeptide transporter [Siphonobacter sp. SORGH_AS_1065]